MSSDVTATTTVYLNRILDEVHPMMADALLLAAVPVWFNADLFAAMRQIDDGRNEGLIERLLRYSFVRTLSTSEDEPDTYAIRPDERVFLQRRWIARDRDAYLTAHQRALDYWESAPDLNPQQQRRLILYHLLFVDQTAGINTLIDSFRLYHKERQITEIERLLDTVNDARFYLAVLGQDLELLDDLLRHMWARVNQLRGLWSSSLATLETLRHKPNLSPLLRPYVIRAHGESLAQMGQFVEAIEAYEETLILFEAEEQRLVTGEATAVSQPEVISSVTDQRRIQIEHAYTKLALGDAYVGLAEATREHNPPALPEPPNRLHQLRDFAVFLLSLPLLIYMSIYLGRRVWHPRFWPILLDLDWIVARLFVSGAHEYKQADQLLEQYGEPTEAVAADEKLAYLYLSLDDNQQAETLFRRLLAEDEAPLGGYRRLSVNLGLAEALLGQGEPEAAQHYANEALPEIRQYEDDALEARARVLLAEAHLGLAATSSNEVQAAILQFERALGLYQQLNDELWVTEIADRLHAIAHDEQLDDNQQEAAQRVATAVSEYTYPIRYRHPATVLFRHAIFIFLSIVIFLLPLYTIRLDTGSLVSPAITFKGREFVLWPSLIFQELEDTPANPEAEVEIETEAPAVSNTAAPFRFRPAITDAGLTVNAIPSADTDVALQVGVGMLVVYVLLSTVVGIAALVFTPLRTLQQAGRGRVRLNGQRLRVNDEQIAWEDITKLIVADLMLIREPLADDSDFALNSDMKQLIVPGNTARYETVRRRIEGYLPAALPQEDWSYRLVYGRMGVWYIGSVVVLLVLALLGSRFPMLLNYDFPATPYSLADLYPYLYLGLFVPPLWAFVLRPLQIRHHMFPGSRLAEWIGLAGLVLLLLRLGSLFYPWFTMPDIYPSLGILLMIGGATRAFWQSRIWPDKPRPYPAWLRFTALFIALFTLFVMGSHLWREVFSYHYLIVGNSLRDRSLLMPEQEPANDLARKALDAYDEAIETAQDKILGVDTRAAVRLLDPLLRDTKSVWFQALSNRAAIYMQLGDFADALNDYDQLVSFADNTELLASRNMARLGESTQADEDTPDSQTILKEQGRLIYRQPNNAYYRLWRGVTYHIEGAWEAAETNYQAALEISGEQALNQQSQVQAWTGLGWLAYGQNQFETAVERFEKAISLNDGSDEAYLGLGFSYYSLHDYDKALEAWQKTAELIPRDPTIYISLGTLHWRLGMLQDEQGTLTQDRCTDPDLSEEQRLASAADLELAIENFKTALSLPGRVPTDMAETYQSLARVQYLLRNCPGYDSVEVRKDTYNSYSEAIELNPEIARYWHVRGRIAYEIWRNLPEDTGPSARVWLFDALEDTDVALMLDPVDFADYQPNFYRETIYPHAVNGTLTQGDKRFANGEYDVALGYYELVATRAPDVVRAPFKAGLASVALGEFAQAEQWYSEGLQRAEAADDGAAVLLAQADLIQFANRAQAEVDVTPLLSLLRSTELEVDPADIEDAETAFALAQVALLDRQWQQAALLGNLGLELAVLTEDIVVVRAAGANLAAYQLSYPDVTLQDIYWPLFGGVGTAVSDLERPDLYWRYRAEYGFRFVQNMFSAQPGWENNAARVYTQIIADVERAYELNPEEHQTWRDFFVDANLGWHYLRRGDRRYQEARYQDALNDYLRATQLIQPTSENALNDRTEAVFKVGLTALRLEEFQLAEEAYAAGLTLLARYEGNDAQLGQARTELEDLLLEEPSLTPIGGAILEDLDEAE
ncbi:MAG: hypothetical protein CL608_19585 [Anaerolineaceae bacterium]|nr:hypothetical protein [Anaerolineaceae bacterium]